MTTTKDVVANSAPIAQYLFSLITVVLLLFLAFQLVQNIQDVGGEIIVGLFPANLEILFPILRPWAAIVVDKSRISVRGLLRLAINISDIAQAFDVGKTPRRIVQCRSAIETHVHV